MLLPLRRAYLVADCPDVDLFHVSSRLVSLRPVPSMGWNWILFFCQDAVEADIFAAGVENASLVRDRQVVQMVELSPMAAGHVDNVAVIGECRPRVVDTTATIPNRLENDGLLCKGTEEPSDHQRFFGHILDCQGGCMSFSQERLWKQLCLSLMDAAAAYCPSSLLARPGVFDSGHIVDRNGELTSKITASLRTLRTTACPTESL